MFFGTGLIFKTLYFVSAMAPAYLLFSLQLFIYNGIGTLTISKFKLPWISLLVIMLAMVSIFVLRRMLYKATCSEENPYTIDLKRVKIIQVNGDIVSFFVGVILPAVFFIENSALISCLVFLTIQLFIFILVSKSNTVFPLTSF